MCQPRVGPLLWGIGPTVIFNFCLSRWSLSLRRCRRHISMISPSQRCWHSSISAHVLDPCGHLKWALQDIRLLVPISFWCWKGILLMAPTGSTLICFSNSQSSLHPDWDHVGMTILLTLMARPLAINSKSVCTQILGLLLFNSPITARKTTCNPDYWVGLFLPSSIRTLPPASIVWQPLEKDPVHKPTSFLLVN